VSNGGAGDVRAKLEAFCINVSCGTPISADLLQFVAEGLVEYLDGQRPPKSWTPLKPNAAEYPENYFMIWYLASSREMTQFEIATKFDYDDEKSIRQIRDKIQRRISHFAQITEDRGNSNSFMTNYLSAHGFSRDQIDKCRAHNYWRT
jgi:hypothetical protein